MAKCLKMEGALTQTPQYTLVSKLTGNACKGMISPANVRLWISHSEVSS